MCENEQKYEDDAFSHGEKGRESMGKEERQSVANSQAYTFAWLQVVRAKIWSQMREGAESRFKVGLFTLRLAILETCVSVAAWGNAMD